MKDRTLQSKHPFPAIFCLFSLLIPLFFCACSSIPRERRLDDYIIVHTTEEDSPDSLAAQYLNHPSEKKRILEFNQIDAIVAGRDVVIPLKPFQPGGITSEGYQIIPVLAYRQFTNQAASPGSLPVSAFENQMKYLAENDCTVITLDRLFSFFHLQEQLPEKAVVIIFDSTDRSIYDDAFPVLQKYRFPAVLFITPDQVGKAKMLHWEQISRMSESSMNIQCRIPNDIYRFPSNGTFYRYFQNLKNEVEKAVALTETKLDVKCRFFLYPPGDHQSLLIRLLEKQGFQGAFIDQEGENPFFTDPFTIHYSQVSPVQDIKKFEPALQFFQKVNNE